MVHMVQAGGVEITTGSELLAEQERARDPKVRAEAQAAREKARRAALRNSARPVTVGAVLGHRNEPTVRQAATALVERFCGSLRVEDGHAIVISPPFGRGAHGQGLREAVQVLTAAAPLLVAAAGKDGRVEIGKLPDRPVTPDGFPV